MTWAARRRLIYILGILIVFFVVCILPFIIYWYTSLPPACPAGTMRQPGISSGPCPLLNEALLQPHAVLWARAFQVRPGVYDAIAYIQNPNPNAGVLSAPYKFSFYDSDNVLVAEQTGTTYIMPQSVTPVFISDVQSGNRGIAHTYFSLESPLTWQKLGNTADGISVDGKELSDVATMPRLSAIAHNNTVADRRGMLFVAVLFDVDGDAIAASQTALDRLPSEQSADIVFTWPTALTSTVGRIDIIPVSIPEPVN